MKRIEALEQAIENKVSDLRKEGINPTLFWAYRSLEESGNEKSISMRLFGKAKSMTLLSV